MTSTRNKFLLALVALVLLATYAAAVKGDCSVENCATCLEEDATQCAECNNGYRPTDAGQCEAIPCDVPNCATCAAGSTTQCAECKPGYRPTDAGQCEAISCDVPNCATCAAGSTTQCAECNADYQLTTEGQCVAASDAAAAPHSGVAAVAALAAAVVAYAL
ncbi:surface antigen-like protein, putative [Leishmania panamensis]|uniref:Surface antigen-like protein, putative n=1 Tax=Leishmania panamensis TaxID=5679 RepID=A0AC62A6B3_LEIPA